MKPRVVILVLVGLVFIGGASAYMRETEEIRVPVKVETRCLDEKHRGNNLLGTETREMTMTRWAARSVGVRVEHGACPVCLEKRRVEERIAKAKVAEAERKARAKEEADKLIQNLEVQFRAVNLDYASAEYWDRPYGPQAQKLKVGGRIAFIFFFKNTSQSPIPEGEIRAIVRPMNNIIYGHVADLWHVDYTHEASNSRKVIQMLANKGLRVPKILPFNSPYHAGENTIYKLEIDDLWHLSELNSSGNYLAISPKTKPGQTIQFDGYISIKGHEIAVGTVTVHIMYPE